MSKITTRPNLFVIRSADTDLAVKFYQLIGLTFTKHSHRSGPEHYAAETEGFVFEIYPLPTDMPPTISARIGFCVENVDATVRSLVDNGYVVVSSPKDSPWGRRAVVKDFDGHSVELTSAISD